VINGAITMKEASALEKLRPAEKKLEAAPPPLIGQKAS
jgi:hypothetical protein